MSMEFDLLGQFGPCNFASTHSPAHEPDQANPRRLAAAGRVDPHDPNHLPLSAKCHERTRIAPEYRRIGPGASGVLAQLAGETLRRSELDHVTG